MILRLFLFALLLGIAGAAGGVTLLWGETHGWWAKTLPAAERSAMIAAQDEYYVPDAARFGPGPYPAVTVMHNCYGGLDQPRMWAKLLADNGYVAQVTDSFTGRPLGGEEARWLTCHMAFFYPVERAGDVMTSVLRLQAHPAVDPNRIAVWGLSHGGTTVIEAIQMANDGVAPPGFDAIPTGYADNSVQAYLIMFPNCGMPNQQRGFSTDKPFLWLQGTADIVTPFIECEDIVATARARGTSVSMHLYEGANHNFDQLEGGLANPDRAQGAAHLEDAKARALAFLKRHL